jgi:hypothetical protein
MFFGTTPQVISQYLFKELKQHSPKRVYIPFAGNFVVEQIAYKACPTAEIHSTDVSIYSRAIGLGVNDMDFKLEIKSEFQEDFSHLVGKEDPLEKAAIVIFFTEVAPAMLKKGKIQYYQNMYDEAIDLQEMYFGKILEKLKQFKAESKFKFYGVDACDILPDCKKGDFVFYDPPVILGDYEKMYAAMEDCLDFDSVGYTEITEEIKEAHLKDLSYKGCMVYWRTNNPVIPPEELEEVYRYTYKWGGNYCLYSNEYFQKFVGRWSPLKEIVKNIRIIGKDDVITEKSKVEIIEQPSAVGNHYRMMWTKKAQMTDSGYCFLIMVDEKLIGMVQLADSLKFGSELMIINSDPAAPTSRYKRLSKLVLYLICNKQVIKIINDKIMWEHTGFTTRIFSNNPMSMKYRSLFKLAKREEDKTSDYKFCLIYQNRDKIFDTPEDGLKIWVQKESKHVKADG